MEGGRRIDGGPREDIKGCEAPARTAVMVSAILSVSSVSALVTAVITTHARPQHVYDALASVCAETYPDVECIVVDDAGTFQPPPGLAQPVRVLRSGMGGVASARNAGLAAAHGEFIIFLDDDDVALPDRIATLVAAADRHRADLAFGRTRRVLPGSAVQLPDVPTAVMPSDHIGLCDILTCTPHVNSVLVRTSALRAVGGFDQIASHFDDWSAWIRLADRQARICSTPRIVAEWRLHDAGLSAKVLQIRAMKARILALFQHLLDHLTADGLKAIATARTAILNADVFTYDDYADAMAAAQLRLHGAGQCIGPRWRSHELHHGARAIERMTV